MGDRHHRAAIAPRWDRIQGLIESERALRFRSLMGDGVAGMLSGLSPTMRWEAPVLHVTYPAEDRDLHLNGRGLRLVPSSFCWGAPVSFADPDLQPVLCYPILREAPTLAAEAVPDPAPGQALAALLGQVRAAVLRGTANGATTGELARALGVSASSASRHATVLRDAGLITSARHGPAVLHTLTPAGASLLRAAAPSPRVPLLPSARVGPGATSTRGSWLVGQEERVAKHRW